MRRPLLGIGFLLVLGCSSDDKQSNDTPDARIMEHDAEPASAVTPGYVSGNPNLPLRWFRVMAAPPPAPRACGAKEDDGGGNIGDVRYTYDANGYPATETGRWPNGQREWSYTFSYDGSRLVHADMDELRTGHVFDATYDPNGRLVRTADDRDGNGTLDDVREVLDYDVTGQPSRIRRTAGAVLIVLRYTFDRYGRVVTETADTNDDGSVETTRTCEYDDRALVMTCRGQELAGATTRKFELRWRDPARLASYTVWTDPEAAPSFAGTFTYDDSGKLLSAELGDIPVTLTFLYDCP